jgi:hypothetical protein
MWPNSVWLSATLRSLTRPLQYTNASNPIVATMITDDQNTRCMRRVKRAS